MSADKIDPRRQGGSAFAGDPAFYAPDIGHRRSRSQVRRNLGRERDDGVDRGCDDDEAGSTAGRGERVGRGIAPRLVRQRRPSFGPARPDHDSAGQVASTGGAGDRPAQKAGSEDGQLIEHLNPPF